MNKTIQIFILLTLIYNCKLDNKNTENINKGNKNKGNITIVDTKKLEGMRFGFYNTENLFDIYDDKYTIDEEYTPNSQKKWDEEKYNKKINDLAKAIIEIDAANFPVFMGLGEVENRKVVEDLINKTDLNKVNYGIVHEDSPDKRGIDLAIIYNKDFLTELSHENIEIVIEGEDDFYTRDIIYGHFKTNNNDEIHIFLNHWSSRREGQKETEYRRVAAAKILRDKVDKLLAKNPEAKIIIMGDFNDYPNDESILNVLKAKGNQNFDEGNLFNLAFELEENDKGTYNYRGDWGMLDQIIISKGVYNANNGNGIKSKSCSILESDWLKFCKNKNVTDCVPSKTYGGNKYFGGISDHFPIYSQFE